ncbi:MAG: BrnA antitoxin family protein [Luteimonas sp.]
MKSASSPSAKRPAAERSSSSMQSKTDWTKLKSGGRVTAAADHPEADVRHIVRGIVRRGLKPQPPKAAISLRIEQDVLEWFKAQGAGYQTRINAVLRAYRDASV